jgi:hypothetical protein
MEFWSDGVMRKASPRYGATVDRYKSGNVKLAASPAGEYASLAAD